MRGRIVPLALMLALLLAPATQAAFPWEETITLAEPRVGDAGLYRPGDVLVDGEPEEAGDETRLAFELSPLREVLDAYGVPRSVSELRLFAVSGEESLEFPVTSWVHRRGAPALATDLSFSAGAEEDAPGPFGQEEGFNVSIQRLAFAHRGEAPWGPECLLLTPLAGVELAEGAELPLGNLCGEDVEAAAAREDATVHLEVAEVQALEGGGTAARLLLTAQAPYGTLEVDIWYRESIPYPVEITFRLHLDMGSMTTSETGEDGEPSPLASRMAGPLLLMAGATDEYGEGSPESAEVLVAASILLERFQRGSGLVIPAGGLPAWPAHHAAVTMAPLGPWGPEDGPSTFVYSLSEATASIREDPTLTELQAWREDHPEARVVAAIHREVVEETQRREVWQLVLAAPDATGYLATSERVVEVRAPGQGLLEVPAPVTRNEATRADELVAPGTLERLPQQLPTVASAVAAWRAVAPEAEDGRTANVYSWSALGNESHLKVGWSDPGNGSLSNPLVLQFDEAESIASLSLEDGAVADLERMRTQGSWSWVTGEPEDEVAWTAAGFQGTGADPIALGAPVVVGAASVSLVALIALVLVKTGLGLPLYSRLSREELLDNSTRRRVYEVVQETPGLPLAEVARKAGCSTSTARYHLGRLARENMVGKAGHDHSKRWFPAGELDRATMEREAVLAVGHSREAYEAICRAPGASLSEVAERLDTSPPAAHKVVTRLVEAGLVRKERDGRRVALHPVVPGSAENPGA